MKIVHRMMRYRFLITLTLTLVISMAKAQSVLQSGHWVKVGVTESGIYKLDRNYLDGLGFPVETLDPQTVRIFGNGGGGMLPQLNSDPRPFDLIENAIYAVGESDGLMDGDDYFLFYARSSDKIEWNASGITFENNLYSDTTYYFVTYGGGLGKRISTVASESEQVDKISTFDDAHTHEVDEENILSSGRKWYGESFSPATQLTSVFDFSFENVISYESIEVAVMARSNEACSMDVLLNGDAIGTLNVDAIPDQQYTIKGEESFDEFPLSGNSENIEVKINFNPGAGVSIGYLDWFVARVKRNLSLTDEGIYFRSLESLNNSISSYSISNATNSMHVWDVSESTAPYEIQFSLVNDAAIFSANSETLKEYVAFVGDNFPAPEGFGTVPNQSIKSNVSVEGIIVAHPEFSLEAQRLADFHAANAGLSIAVVTTQEVYNEFSSGMQDVSAIRDYAKYVYDEGGQLRYLLLIGDGSFDYKERIFENSNFVPIYESRESLHPIFSHSSDDYFGFLEDADGEWIESTLGDHTMEIGVGRLPVKTIEEAQTVVDKIIRYSTSPATMGKWKNEIVYVADDGDTNIHMDHGEALAGIADNSSHFNTRKLYLDAFDQEMTPLGMRSSSMTRAINLAIKNGAFFVDFIGHGSELVWMDERVLVKSEIQTFTNYQRLPIFVTATCEFGRYDDPRQVSGAEDLLLREQGAAALLTTTRPVFANTNFFLNEAFHEAILGVGISGDIRLGDILKYTKNNSLKGPVNRNFALLGDPMMRPAYPKYEVIVDQFQEVEPDTLSALERVVLTGSVQLDGVIQQEFNGRILVDLFDIPTAKITKGQESNAYTYYEQDNALFRGEATVSDGEFSFEFIVPRNISYKNQPGKFSFYAFSDEADANGSSRNLVIGGTDKTAAEDSSPPELTVYLNEPSFKNGSRVGSGAVLIAKFSDESGMNISNTGFEKGITVELNGEIIELNDYYTSDVDDFTKGTVVYPLQDLEPGNYKAKIKGSDTYNNPVEETVDFVVSNQPILQTFNFTTYPNPAHSFTHFSFEHDREGETLEVMINLYSLHGDRIISKLETVDFSFRNVDVQLDFNGNRVMDGMYMFHVIIRSLADGAAKEITGRLVIRN